MTTAAELNTGDRFEGNGGTNYVQIMTSGAVTAANLAFFTEVQFVGLSAGGSVQFADNLTTSTLYATGSAAADTLNGNMVNR